VSFSETASNHDLGEGATQVLAQRLRSRQWLKIPRSGLGSGNGRGEAFKLNNISAPERLANGLGGAPSVRGEDKEEHGCQEEDAGHGEIHQR
jgi:hypothetical protein